ncbi:hypothetical protein D3C72_2009600 [compost metagenome]
MQDDQLWLGALRGKHLRSHLQQGFIFGVFIRLKIAVFQELSFIGTLGNAGNRRVIFSDLALIGKPPRLETGAVGQRDKVILVLRFPIDHAA